MKKLLLLVISLLLFTACFSENAKEYRYERLLPVPPLLEGKMVGGEINYEFTVQKGVSEILEGVSTPTYGYNGAMLGPTIKVRKGEDYRFKIHNNLGERTSVHWHGLRVSGEMDGGPNQMFIDGDYWEPYYRIEQNAATLWYHPHTWHKTGEHAYMGLAGMYIIEDEISDALPIPKEYGIDDFPIIIQDKRFDRRGNLIYSNSHRDAMYGVRGDTLIVNGILNPVFKVEKKFIRMRILNGSNASSYEYSFSDSREFYQIATDGGFLEKSNKIDKIFLSPGERAEIIVEFKESDRGKDLFLVADDYMIMKIDIINLGENIKKIPTNLVKFEEYDIPKDINVRRFVLEGLGNFVSINGKQMDMSRIDEYVKLNELEIWEIVNNTSGMMGGMMGGRNSDTLNGGRSLNGHPFHVHAVQFRVLSRNGRNPEPYEDGWKDTIFVDQGEVVRVAVKFEDKGLFMYHCHILEHEDNGMMGTFLVD